MNYLVRWQYEGGYEAARLDRVEARDRYDAVAEIVRRHGGQRGKVQILEVKEDRIWPAK